MIQGSTQIDGDTVQVQISTRKHHYDDSDSDYEYELPRRADGKVVLNEDLVQVYEHRDWIWHELTLCADLDVVEQNYVSGSEIPQSEENEDIIARDLVRLNDEKDAVFEWCREKASWRRWNR